jgi:putative spermidine/putrescine transport system permease protein
MAQSALPIPHKRVPTFRLGKWLGVLPFFLFAILFLLLPSMRLFIGSFTDTAGQFTFNNIVQLLDQPSILNAYWLSIQISAVTAIGGGLLGFLLAYSVTVGGLPKPLRSILITFSGVASNFAGVPLAFAFVATLGRTGFITALFKNVFHTNIYDHGFNLYSFIGLSLTYMYFQLPSILGSMILLFGNAFGAYATAYALTGGALPIITIQIGAQIRGDVLHNPGLGYAMAMGMVVIMAISLAGYTWLQGWTERWLR